MSLTHDEMTLSPDAYSSAGPASPQASPAPWTRVYRKRGRLAHLRYEGVLGIACRRFSRDTGHEDHWLGTGSQAEYDQVAGMPLCPECFRVREAHIGDPWLGAGHDTEME